MKNLKKGFTLAEVLITLAIIGVVAAIVMPNLMNNNQYKTIGVKLAKFMSTTEGASRAFVASNETFSTIGDEGQAAVNNFINDTYLINEVSKPSSESSSTDDDTDNEIVYELSTGIPTGYLNIDENTYNIAKLKDSTAFSAAMCTDGNAACNYDAETAFGKGIVGGQKTGEPVFVLSFEPLAKGIPAKVHHYYNFVVTELGFVYPAANDECLWNIYNNKFSTNSNTFAKTSACYENNSSPATGD